MIYYYLCYINAYNEDSLRLGIIKVNFASPLGLHYLCCKLTKFVLSLRSYHRSA